MSEEMIKIIAEIVWEILNKENIALFKTLLELEKHNKEERIMILEQLIKQYENNY